MVREMLKMGIRAREIPEIKDATIRNAIQRNRDPKEVAKECGRNIFIKALVLSTRNRLRNCKRKTEWGLIWRFCNVRKYV